jgi:hypothetical protein
LHKFALVLQGDSLCFLISMAIKKHILFVKATARTHSAKAFSLLKKLLLFVHHQGTLTLTLRNSGFFYAPSTVRDKVLVIGTTRLIQFFVLLV